jgi:hypothetical protein
MYIAVPFLVEYFVHSQFLPFVLELKHTWSDHRILGEYFKKLHLLARCKFFLGELTVFCFISQLKQLRKTDTFNSIP